METNENLSTKYANLKPYLNEQALRLSAAADALMLGRGGISCVSRASGLSRTTIHAGIKELQGEIKSCNKDRIRHRGGGRKKTTDKQEKLLKSLDVLLDPVTRGDLENPLRWSCKSTTKIAEELQKEGYNVSQSGVWRLLDELGYSMQSNRKVKEGGTHPDRNEQFEYINESVKDFLKRGFPVISVDCKKKENLGEYRNTGREWEKKREPQEVKVYDFIDKKKGKAIPYGIYDLCRNEGWVNVGVTRETAEFAVNSIEMWWKNMGLQSYSESCELLITADGGGSNGSRVKLWKKELHGLALRLGITIHVRHFPPGTSKWNKIEHRMFSHITENWRGRPLTERMTVVNLISNTTTQKGLKIQASLDEKEYEKGKKVTDEELKKIPLNRCSFHGEWNYSISPA